MHIKSVERKLEQTATQTELGKTISYMAKRRKVTIKNVIFKFIIY